LVFIQKAGISKKVFLKPPFRGHKST